MPRIEVGRHSVAQEHIPLVRRNVTEILRVLAKSENGCLRYNAIEHLVNVEMGHRVSGVHAYLKDLARGGLVRQLPRGEGWEITRVGREFHDLLERILSIADVSSGNGGAGGR